MGYGYGGPPGFGPPGGGFTPPGGPMTPGTIGDVNTTLPLVLSILAVTPGMGPIGLVGLVFAIMAISAKAEGNLERARSHAKASLVLACVSLGISLLAFLGWLLVVVVFGVALMGAPH